MGINFMEKIVIKIAREKGIYDGTRFVTKVSKKICETARQQIKGRNN